MSVMTVTDFPVLRIRANDPVSVAEVKLGDVDLIPLRVNSIRLDMQAGDIATATLTFHVTPDIELPAEIKAVVVDLAAEAEKDEQ